MDIFKTSSEQTESSEENEQSAPARVHVFSIVLQPRQIPYILLMF